MMTEFEIKSLETMRNIEKNLATISERLGSPEKVFSIAERDMATKETADAILDKFEDLLSEYGIKIPDEDRAGDETEACIYGKNYYDLEEEIINLLLGYKGYYFRNLKNNQ